VKKGRVNTASTDSAQREAMSKEKPCSTVYSLRNAKIPSGRRNGHAVKQQDYSTRMHNGFRTRGAAARNQLSHWRKDSGGNPPRISRANYSDMLHPADMTGVPRHISEHMISIREGCLPVMQKKRGQAPERNKAIREEVEKLMDIDIMKEDLNKAFPNDGYPLPKIDWKVESLYGYPFKCFLDAYKGYHQIKMAGEDEEKTAFITSQGIFRYSKMSFELKNVEATYQRLVDKAFQKHIGRNLEVYLDNLVIKSRTEKEVMIDINETFNTLREINIKLNPKKCAFGMREGTFLGYKVDADGLRVCLDKVEVVLNLPSPKCLKNVQKLNGKLASLNRFLSKTAEKSLPFFKTLKKCTKKSDFQWTAEAKMAFKQMKKLIAELPMLTIPKEKEELIMYLADARETNSAVLMTERDGKQMPVYFVSCVLQGPKVNYTPMEKLILALMLSNPEVAGRLLKWRFKLEEHDIHYRPRTPVKGHILADFIVKRPEDDPLDTPIEDKEELLDPWVLCTDRSLCIDGFEAGLIITNPKRMEFTYALRFKSNATYNETEYEALIAGLRITEQMEVKNLQANVDSILVANQVNGVYVAKEPGMIKYLEKVKNLASTFKEFSIKQVPRGENKKADALSKMASTSFAHLSKQVLVEELKEKPIEEKDLLAKLTPFTSPWPLYKLGINIVGPFPEGLGKVKFLIMVIDYFTKWIEAKPVATITGAQCFTFVKHPQANDLVERANRSLGEGIKAQLDERSKNWLGEISHVLWAHLSMIKSSNGETPFSLTYGAEAVISVEIGMPTLRTAEVDMIKNDEAMGINLDLLEEKREQTAIQEAKSKAKMEKY
nr:reverse transcriptase domain-containing protein [Tanacetum cinerariifolium]